MPPVADFAVAARGGVVDRDDDNDDDNDMEDNSESSSTSTLGPLISIHPSVAPAASSVLAVDADVDDAVIPKSDPCLLSHFAAQHPRQRGVMRTNTMPVTLTSTSAHSADDITFASSSLTSPATTSACRKSPVARGVKRVTVSFNETIQCQIIPVLDKQLKADVFYSKRDIKRFKQEEKERTRKAIAALMDKMMARQVAETAKRNEKHIKKASKEKEAAATAVPTTAGVWSRAAMMSPVLSPTKTKKKKKKHSSAKVSSNEDENEEEDEIDVFSATDNNNNTDDEEENIGEANDATTTTTIPKRKAKKKMKPSKSDSSSDDDGGGEGGVVKMKKKKKKKKSLSSAEDSVVYTDHQTNEPDTANNTCSIVSSSSSSSEGEEDPASTNTRVEETEPTLSMSFCRQNNVTFSRASREPVHSSARMPNSSRIVMDDPKTTMPPPPPPPASLPSENVVSSGDDCPSPIFLVSPKQFSDTEIVPPHIKEMVNSKISSDNAPLPSIDASSPPDDDNSNSSSSSSSQELVLTTTPVPQKNAPLTILSRRHDLGITPGSPLLLEGHLTSTAASSSSPSNRSHYSIPPRSSSNSSSTSSEARFSAVETAAVPTTTTVATTIHVDRSCRMPSRRLSDDIGDSCDGDPNSLAAAAMEAVLRVSPSGRRRRTSGTNETTAATTTNQGIDISMADGLELLQGAETALELGDCDEHRAVSKLDATSGALEVTTVTTLAATDSMLESRIKLKNVPHEFTTAGIKDSIRQALEGKLLRVQQEKESTVQDDCLTMEELADEPLVLQPPRSPRSPRRTGGVCSRRQARRQPTSPVASATGANIPARLSPASPKLEAATGSATTTLSSSTHSPNNTGSHHEKNDNSPYRNVRPGRLPRLPKPAVANAKELIALDDGIHKVLYSKQKRWEAKEMARCALDNLVASQQQQRIMMNVDPAMHSSIGKSVHHKDTAVSKPVRCPSPMPPRAILKLAADVMPDASFDGCNSIKSEKTADQRSDVDTQQLLLPALRKDENEVNHIQVKEQEAATENSDDSCLQGSRESKTKATKPKRRKPSGKVDSASVTDTLKDAAVEDLVSKQRQKQHQQRGPKKQLSSIVADAFVEQPTVCWARPQHKTIEPMTCCARF